VNCTSSDIVLHDPDRWNYSSLSYEAFVEQGLLYTSRAGTSLSYTFNGVAIWYDCLSHIFNMPTDLFRRHYGTLGPRNSFFTVSIDGSRPQQLSTKHDVILNQRMVWSETNLAPGRHTVTLTALDNTEGLDFDIDFFR